MKTCSNCGTANRPDARFCIGCGRGFEQAAQQTSAVTCPACGHANETGDVFCTNCGAALQPTAPARQDQPSPVSADLAPAAGQDREDAAKEEKVAPDAETSPTPPPADTASTMADAPECPACGYVIRFCPGCGAPLHTAPDGQLVHGQPPPTP
jgi:membrane protease subunit (stomatin/prohibitin family)